MFYLGETLMSGVHRVLTIFRTIETVLDSGVLLIMLFNHIFPCFRHRHAEDHLCAALKVPVISCA